MRNAKCEMRNMNKHMAARHQEESQEAAQSPAIAWEVPCYGSRHPGRGPRANKMNGNESRGFSIDKNK